MKQSIFAKGRDACVSGTGPRRYAGGRVCVDEECTTVLSMYNRSSYCWQHDPGRWGQPVRADRLFSLSRT